jgi:hypothetical protein
VEFVRQSGVFLDVVGDNHETYINWNNGVETRRIFAAQATKNYFTVLGIPVIHGRGWVMDDPDEVVVLSFRFWRTHFGADPSVVGRSIRLDSRAYTVVGILPESHRTLIGYGFSPDVYVPRYTDDTLLAICARLRPGMSLGEARAALQTIGERLDRELPEKWKYGRSSRITPLVGFARLQQDQELRGLPWPDPRPAGRKSPSVFLSVRAVGGSSSNSCRRACCSRCLARPWALSSHYW